MKNRIKELREAQGWSQSDLGDQLGVGYQTIIRYESGKVPSSRLPEIGRIFRAPMAALIDDGETVPVQVRSHVEAGHWAEALEWDPDDWYYELLSGAGDLRGHKLQGAEVRGDSMNRRYPEGTIIVFSDHYEPLLVGKRYVVERERADGMREATVKRLWQDQEGRRWLVPESDDPRFQPFPIDGDEGDTVRILGRVVRVIQRE